MTVPFEFTAGDKVLPAGNYKLERDATRPGLLKIQGAKGGTLFLPVVTRLAATSVLKSPSFVFDKVNGKTHLSEVWVPGEDGYLLKATHENHQHEILLSTQKAE